MARSLGVRTYLPWVLLGMVAGQAAAQDFPGTTVQLPTFSFFGTGTTVSVPDRGSVLMGGINRASSGRSEFGVPMAGKLPFVGPLFKNNSIGSERSASNVRVTVWIHDFEEMENSLLGQATPYSSLSSTAFGGLQPQGNAFTRMLEPRRPDDPRIGSSWELSTVPCTRQTAVLSAADERVRREQKRAVRGAEAEKFYARALSAEQEGKTSVAKVYYQMAARRATGELRSQVLAKLEAIGRAATGSAVAGTGP